jgi:hypothetical protein
MKPNHILFVTVLMLICTKLSAQRVVINEFMSDNESTLKDRDGDYVDWIELYNSGSQDVNLKNYALSDEHDEIRKWVFPARTIPAKGFLIVYASKKNSNTGGELHTNFKIKSEGESLYLSDATGRIIDQTPSVGLPDDQSYGRVPDGGMHWIKMIYPTPDASNTPTNAILFSQPAGFYTHPFLQEIRAINGDTIYYTLNGSEPTPSSMTYNGAIKIGFRSHLPNIYSMIPSSPKWVAPVGQVDKSTTLRCASYKNGQRTSDIYTLTFFVDANARKKYSMPVISLVTDSLNLFDDENGIYVRGSAADTSTYWTGNYFTRGRVAERPIHIEYFSEQGDLQLSQDAGVRIHGGYTRGLPQKSFRLYARGDYGETKFHHKLLPHRNLDQYDRFVLRTSLATWYDQTIMQDMLCQDLCRDLNIDGQDVRPVLVFLNGEYWGIYPLRDRLDERYLNYMHGVDKDSVEFRENWEIKGEPLAEFLDTTDITNDQNYAVLKTKIDIDKYIDYQIAQQFLVNYDWPGNNVKRWRTTDSKGKWRWIYHDLDGTFANASYPMIRHCTLNDTSIKYPNPPHTTFLFRNLIKNQAFVNQFLGRYQELIHTDFNRTHMSYRLNDIKNQFTPEIQRQTLRWHSPKEWYEWDQDIDSILLPFVNERSCYVEEYIRAHFATDNFHSDCIRHEKLEGKQLIVAPNPGEGEFTIHNSASTIPNAQIIIYNSALQEVYQSKAFDFVEYSLHTIDLKNLPSQTYILRLSGDNFSEVHKLIILR